MVIGSTRPPSRSFRRIGWRFLHDVLLTFSTLPVTFWGWPDFCHMLAQLFFCSFAQHHCNFRKTLAKVPDAVTVQPASRGSQYFYCKVPLLWFVLFNSIFYSLYFVLWLYSELPKRIICNLYCRGTIVLKSRRLSRGSITVHRCFLNYFAKNLFGRCAAV